MKIFFKKTLSLALAFACIAQANISFAETVTIKATNEKKQIIDLEVPKNPQRIVVLSPTALDILDKLGLGNRVVGLTRSSNYPEHLMEYINDSLIENVGTMKELDMEAIMSLEPDLIFSSDRTVARYKELSMIAPTVASYIEYNKGFYQGFKENAIVHAQIFGKEAELNGIFTGFEKRIAALKAKYEGKTAMLGIFTGGAFHTLGNVGRISIISNDLGFNNITADKNVNHGNISSYELILAKNPEYVFILDKDAAVGREATLAQQLMDNEIIHQTNAYKNNKIIYIAPSNVWYVADGGLTAMDIMLKNIESIENNK